MNRILPLFPCLLPLLSTPALAGDLVQELTWDVLYEGQKVGERTATIKYVPDQDGTRRIIESTTTIDATAKGIPYTFEQRLTAHAGNTPASFHSVVKDNGAPREIQGRYTPVGWTVSVVERGRTRSWDLAATKVNLSSADLLDPETRVPLTALQSAQLMSVETGEVITGDVKNLGTSEVDVGGTPMAVNGVAWESSTGPSTFYYTSDGVLVRYEIDVMGKSLVATLREAPPPGVDDRPVPTGASGITEVEL